MLILTKIHPAAILKLVITSLVIKPKILFITKDKITTTVRPQIPCQPSPCGPNAECQVVNGHEACSCLPGYTGRPPLCRPECVINAECPTHLACIQQKCKDPCIGACGIRANCQVVNHNAICSCPTGFRGDPFAQCSEIPPSKFYSKV